MHLEMLLNATVTAPMAIFQFTMLLEHRLRTRHTQIHILTLEEGLTRKLRFFISGQECWTRSGSVPRVVES